MFIELHELKNGGLLYLAACAVLKVTPLPDGGSTVTFKHESHGYCHVRELPETIVEMTGAAFVELHSLEDAQPFFLRAESVLKIASLEGKGSTVTYRHDLWGFSWVTESAEDVFHMLTSAIRPNPAQEAAAIVPVSDQRTQDKSSDGGLC